MKPHGPYVSCDIIKKYIAMWMSRNPEERTLAQLELETGIPARTLYGIIKGDRATVRFETAERLLIGIGMELAWHYDDDLALVYAAV